MRANVCSPLYDWTGDAAHQRDRRLRRAGAQPQGRLARAAARRARGHHGAVRVGQVVARLRHDLRRGPAPLRRVAERLRAPVPRPDGQARRRLDRGPVAGDLDRPEDDVAQPALDGRHGHRDLRLPAPAVGAHRPPALPHLRQADRRASRPSRSSTRSWSCRRARASWSWRRSCAGARASTASVFEELRAEGFARVEGRRRAADARGRDRARQEVQARHLGRGRPARHARRPAQAPGGLDRDGGRAGRRHGRGRDRAARRRRPTVARCYSEKFACPDHGPSIPELEPRIFSFNSPHGACERCTGLGLADGDRPGARRARPVAVDRRGRAGAVGEQRVAVLRADHRRRSPRSTGSTSRRRGRSCPRTHRDLFLYGTDGDRVEVSYRNRYGRRRSYATRFEGIVPNLERRYRETDSELVAREDRGVHVGACRARPARARGCGRSRARCSSAGSRSTSSRAL